MTDHPPITDTDLHALVDGRLSAARRAQVERYLETDARARQRVQRYRQLNAAIQERYAGVLDEPVPERLTSRRPSRSAPRYWAVAAALGWMVLGGVVGSLLQSHWNPRPEPIIETDLIKPAAFAHLVYTPETRHAVDVTADQEAYLVNWLSTRLHTDIRAPNLAAIGYRLIGGRLLPSSNRMAAQFMYEDAGGNRVTLYVRTGIWANQETAFRYQVERSVGVFYWLDGPLGYALTGAVERDTLLHIAAAVYRELRSPPATAPRPTG